MEKIHIKIYKLQFTTTYRQTDIIANTEEEEFSVYEGGGQGKAHTYTL